MYIEFDLKHKYPWRRMKGRHDMMGLIIILLMIILLDVLSIRWGANSGDGLNSLEWLRRQQWYGFH